MSPDSKETSAIQLYTYTVERNEATRKQIASYLNDTAVQSLSALYLQLSLLLENSASPKKVQAQLGESIPLLLEVVQGLTKMARDLRPLELDTVGLNQTLQQVSEEFSCQSQISVMYEGVDLPPLPETITLAFYRLIQEAFNNILQHTQATEVCVHLTTENNQITLTIQGHGNSFKISQPFVTPGLSLYGLMVWFQHLNGRIEIDSNEGAGVITVTAVLPFIAEADY